MSDATRIAIVGGGITGLTAAYRLQALARERGQPTEITVIEADERLGGKIVTERTDSGFLIEGGPDSMATMKPQGMEFCRELGLGEELIHPPSGKTAYILYNGRLHVLPRGAMGFIPTPQSMMAFLGSDLFSIRGKLRMGLEPFISPNKDDSDESLGSFVERRLGREPMERLAEPLLAGVYASDADRLSLNATFPQFAALERKNGSLVRGAVAARKRRQTAASNQGGPSKPKSVFASLRSGLQSWIHTLAAQLTDARILQGRPVRRVERIDDAEYRLHLDAGTIDADRVLFTTPAHVTAELLDSVSPDASDRLTEIPYASTAIATLAYPRHNVEHPLDATGFLVPRSEPREITACTWSSAKWEGRAPEGYALFRCFFGRSGSAENVLNARDAELADAAAREMGDLVGASGEPVLTRIHRWEGAMPQYEVGHLDKLARIDTALEPFPGLEIAGSGYRGIGLSDCVKQGHQAAERLIEVEAPAAETAAS